MAYRIYIQPKENKYKCELFYRKTFRWHLKDEFISEIPYPQEVIDWQEKYHVADENVIMDLGVKRKS